MGSRFPQFSGDKSHTPIIDARTFAYTQEQLKLRSRSNYRGEKKYATDYSGFLYCGDCGAPMFSMSRPDLKPAYTCGTYHRRGRKGCTSHHVRVDKLDELLKRYVQVVRDNSASMLDQLQDAIRQQPEREQEIGNAIDSLERQLAESKEQLKAMYKACYCSIMSLLTENCNTSLYKIAKQSGHTESGNPSGRHSLFVLFGSSFSYVPASPADPGR